RPRRHADGTGAEGNLDRGPADQPARRERGRHLGRRQAAYGGTVRRRPGAALRQARQEGQAFERQAEGEGSGDAADRRRRP
nr:hypothetical protein [Tanacetum cinerariifolium]